MLSKVSVSPIFKAYKQNFTNEAFQRDLDEALIWAKENVDDTGFLSSPKRMHRRLEKEALKAPKMLEEYSDVFRSSSFESFVELSLQGRDLVGKITFLNTTPMEVRTQLPGNFKKFFTSFLKAAKYQLKEDDLSQKYWRLIDEEKYLGASQRKRIQELTKKSSQNPNPLLLYYDVTLSRIADRLIELTKEKNVLVSELKSLKQKLANKKFTLRLK